MRTAEVKLNFHPNHFCPEDGRRIFIRTIGAHSVSIMNAAFKEGYRRTVPLPLPMVPFLQATIMYAAPPLVLLLASHPGVLPKYLQSLRYVSCAAAPLGGLDAERFLKRAPRDTEILQGIMRPLL